MESKVSRWGFQMWSANSFSAPRFVTGGKSTFQSRSARTAWLLLIRYTDTAKLEGQTRVLTESRQLWAHAIRSKAVLIASSNRKTLIQSTVGRLKSGKNVPAKAAPLSAGVTITNWSDLCSGDTLMHKNLFMHRALIHFPLPEMAMQNCSH